MARIGIAALLLALLQPAAQAEEERLGEVNFPISCSPAAQRQFNRGVALLHTFFYPETTKAFTAIARQEPSCAMAYWGVAISQRPNPLAGPFADDVLERGAEAIAKARAAAAQTERERAWIEALAAFYQDYQTVPQATRTANYEAAMGRLAARYPEDAEAAIFYALALNEAADPTDKSFTRQLKAAAILEAVEPRNPNHPGIPHYIIHSYDYPELAARGAVAAVRCAQLAPSAPHALHMPSHIFATLGMWQEVIAADRAADASSIAYNKRFYPEAAANPARLSGRYHSLDFLTHAHLQLAQDRAAKRILDIHSQMGEYPARSRYTGHTAFAAIPVRYAFERGAWAEAAALQVMRTPFAQAEAISWFGRALGAVRSGDVAAAEAALAELERLKAQLAAIHDAYWGSQVEVQEKAAAAWIALRKGRKADAIALARAGADLEERSGKNVAMENLLSPMRELLAELLLEADEPAAALREFEASLRSFPNRYRSFAGAARAAERLGERAVARAYYDQLLVLTGSADTDRPEIAQARRFVARD